MPLRHTCAARGSAWRRLSRRRGSSRCDGGALSPHSEIRPRRLGQADPLALIVFHRVVGADRFLPLGDQASVGDTGGQRRSKYLWVLHRYFELQSLQTCIGIVTRWSVPTADRAFAGLVSIYLCLGQRAIDKPVAFDNMHRLALWRAKAVNGCESVGLDRDGVDNEHVAFPMTDRIAHRRG